MQWSTPTPVQAALVGCNVGDVTLPDLIGALVVKLRCNRFAAMDRLCLLSAMITNLLLPVAVIPCAFNIRRTRSLPTQMPLAIPYLEPAVCLFDFGMDSPDVG